MTDSNCTAFTVSPSLNDIFCSTPETCGRTVAVAEGVTVPSASSVTGMSARSAAATPTVVAGPPLPPGRMPAAGLLAALFACVRCQTSHPSAASRTTAFAAPMIDERRRFPSTRYFNAGSDCDSSVFRSIVSLAEKLNAARMPTGLRNGGCALRDGPVAARLAQCDDFRLRLRIKSAYLRRRCDAHTANTQGCVAAG